ncbi:hypothetical protein GCM10018783_42030 [Streptomyces griseosporeus]|nr:hypothetical protein GCM10018783_42030 [Streptomyces griseosporeus]
MSNWRVHLGTSNREEAPGELSAPRVPGLRQEVWAHRDHVAEAAGLDPDQVRLLARILLPRAFEAAT